MKSISVTQQHSQSTQEQQNKSYRPTYVFVLQLVDGKYCIGQANNAARRVAAINSGLNNAVPKPYQVYKIVGIKKQNEHRTLVSVVKRFADKYGDDRIVVV